MNTAVHTINTEMAALRKTHQECFACGVSSSMGLHLHFEVDAAGIARAGWMPDAVFRSYPDRVHGGILATMLDSAMVHALFARGIAGVTVEMTLRYKTAVRVDEPVQIAGRVESVRHGIYFCQAELTQDGRTAVTAHAKFMAPVAG